MLSVAFRIAAKENDMASSQSKRLLSRLLLAASLAVPALLSPAPANAQLVLSVGFAPPALPVYAQPICPGEGFIWTPGYWAYGPEGYFWVPGTWVLPPRNGFLWTPGYWGWGGSAFLFHPGYWGPHIGYYGGINYGFGYGGVGYEGGYWRGNSFVYNRSVNHLDGGIRNVYERSVPLQNAAYNHVSYNGGNGGVPYRASASEEAAMRERHAQPTGEQIQHQSFAARSPQQFASANRGRPPVTAASTPGAFRSSPGGPSAQHGVFGPTNAAERGSFGGARPQIPQREGGGQQAYRGGFGSNGQAFRSNQGMSRQPMTQQQRPMMQQREMTQRPMQQQQRMQSAPHMQMQSRPQMQSAPRSAPGGGGGGRPGGGGHPGRR